MMFAPLGRAASAPALECPNKTTGICVSERIRDIEHRQAGGFQQLLANRHSGAVEFPAEAGPCSFEAPVQGPFVYSKQIGDMPCRKLLRQQAAREHGW